MHAQTPTTDWFDLQPIPPWTTPPGHRPPRARTLPNGLEIHAYLENGQNGTPALRLPHQHHNLTAPPIVTPHARIELRDGTIRIWRH